MTDADRPPFSHVVRQEDVPEEGLAFSFELDAAMRESVARFLRIPAVNALRAELAVKPWRGRGLSVRGELSASVVQTCVVTLEAVENDVAEPVSVVYAPAESSVLDEAMDPEAPEDVEPLLDGRIDIGALVVEQLALGLDPYPRRAGVVFEPPAEGAGGQEDPGPFAALAALKKGGRGH